MARYVSSIKLQYLNCLGHLQLVHLSYQNTDRMLCTGVQLNPHESIEYNYAYRKPIFIEYENMPKLWNIITHTENQNYFIIVKVCEDTDILLWFLKIMQHGKS